MGDADNVGPPPWYGRRRLPICHSPGCADGDGDAHVDADEHPVANADPH
jgi:hypothetical protein